MIDFPVDVSKIAYPQSMPREMLAYIKNAPEVTLRVVDWLEWPDKMTLVVGDREFVLVLDSVDDNGDARYSYKGVT